VPTAYRARIAKEDYDPVLLAEEGLTDAVQKEGDYIHLSIALGSRGTYTTLQRETMIDKLHIHNSCILFKKRIRGHYHFSFAQEEWEPEDFYFVASAKYSYRLPFIQQEHCISNHALDNGAAYISMVTRQRFGNEVKITARCAFDYYGAPLIVITDDIQHLPNGDMQMGRHWEIAVLEGGINIWELSLAAGQVISCKLGYARFPVSAGVPFALEVEIVGDTITASLGAHSCRVENVALPESYHVGITACEGINRFEQEYMGRGPKSIHTHLLGSLLVVRLQGVLTAAEQQLVKSLPAEKGRDLLKQVRTHLVETARPVLEAMVQEVTGVKVLSLHHDISTVTGEEVILFTLAESPDLREAKKK
jgi:uncharacterized protein YbcI